METVRKETASKWDWYQQTMGLLDKHVYAPGTTWMCDFVAVKDLKERITKRHPSFTLPTQGIVEYLELQLGYKPESHGDVMGYLVESDGGLFESLEAKRAKRRRVAKKRKAGCQLSLL